MSETDDDDGFDKEAVREELREKYERDKRERETTERMSDLLLKGATMTNSHCGACGDPFFRQNGTTFCPSCHGGPEGVEASVDDADQGSDGQGHASQHARDEASAAATGRADDAAGRDDDPADAGPVAPGDSPATPGTGDAHESGRRTPPQSEPATEQPSTDSTRRRAPADTGQEPNRAHASAPGSTAGDRADAHDSLVAALEHFAREAASTDDPRYARECLEAAREAAEALSALRS